MEPELMTSVAEIIEGFVEFIKGNIEWFNAGYYKLFKRGAEFLAPLATLAAGSFAIYQKWRFAERNMYSRLDEFMAREETRLRLSEEHLAEALQPPSPAIEFGTPIFTEHVLRPALAHMNWGRISLNRPYWSKVDRIKKEVDVAIQELEDQLNLWKAQKVGFERKKFQAHLLKGAIAVSKAAKLRSQGKDPRDFNLEALTEFERASKLDPNDLQSLQYVALQRARLGDYQGARNDFEKLAESASREENALT